MSKIISVEKNKNVSYEQNVHKNFWQERQVSEIPAFGKKSVFTAQSSIVCVMSEKITDTNMLETIYGATKNGNRVYVLTNSQSEETKTLEKSCLVRYSKGIIGSFILDVNKKSGRFWNEPLTEDRLNSRDAICLLLDKEQTEILYRHFCYYFWGAESNSPMDVFPNLKNFCDSEYVQSEINKRKEFAFISNIKDNIESSKIITSLKGNNIGIIPQIAEKGTKILALKNGISIYVIENESAMFIVPKADVSDHDLLWALKLNDEQKRQVKNHLQKLEENADYEFFVSKTRSELVEKYILPLDGNDNIYIESHKEVKLKDNISTELLTEENFKNSEPEESSFTDNGDSVETTYKWMNIPFSLPHIANKHQLYQDWESEIKKINDFLDKILQKIEDTEKKETNVAKAIAGLFLGKKTKFNSLKIEIGKLKSFDFANSETDKLKEQIAKANEINGQISSDIAEIEEENRKAKLDIEIAEMEEKIKEKEASVKKLEQEREEKVNAAKNEEKTEKDIVVIKSKFQSDIDKTKNEIKKLNNEKEQKEKQKNSIPSKRQEHSSLEVFNKNQKANHSQFELTVPKLPYLPKKGELYKDRNVSYLAITNWDDFDIGKQEAKRLSAKLCAKGE